MGNAFALVGGRIAGDAALLAFMLLYARSHGASALGQYALAMSIAGMLSIATSLGLNTVLQRELSRSPGRSAEIAGVILVTQLAAGIASAGLIFAVSFLFFGPGATRQAIWIMGAYHVLVRLSQSVAARFAGHEQMATWSALEAAHKIGILIIAWVGFRNSWNSVSVLAAYPAMGAALLASGWMVATSRFGAPTLRIEAAAWRPMVALGLPFLAIQFVLEFYDRIGVVMLEHMRGVTETGLYAAADRPLTIFTAGLNLLAAAMLPAMARLFIADRRQLAELYDLGSRLAFVVSLPIAGAIAMEADAVVELLFGREFGATVPALEILAWTLPFLGIRFIACTALVATDQQKFLFYLECAAAATYSIAAWLLIPVAGGLALAASKLASVVVFSAIAAARVGVSIRSTWWKRAIPGGSVAMLAMAGVHSITDQWGTLVALSAACAAFALVMVATGCVSARDLAGARRLLRSPNGGVAKERSAAA